jgi:alkylresorcinol/alkylpyrone synthase
MFLTSVATAKLPHIYSQDEICEWYVKQSAGILDAAWLRSVFAATLVQNRRFVLPLEEIVKPRDFGERNRLFLEHAPHLLQLTVTDALKKSSLEGAAVQALATVTSSGFLTPSLDSYVINEAHLSDSTRRLPMVGLGCAAGVSGLAHAVNWAKGAGCQNVVLAAIELNSLTYRPQDIDKVNAVGAALFADGAATVVCRADVACGWKFVGSSSTTLPKSTDLMGWDMDANGYGLILLEDVPEAVAEMAPDNLRRFLEQHGLTPHQIKNWVLHPGGPKILTALQKTTGLPDAAIQRSRDGLARHGNLSSCSVLYALAEFIQEPAKHGDHAMCVAFGPGFSMEMLLLKYQ